MKPGSGEKQAGMDRDAVRARLAVLTGDYGGRAGPDAGRNREILERRAILLATPVKETAVPADQLVLVTFFLGAGRYGVEEGSVRGVARLGKLAPVPGAPSGIAGITMHQGDLLTVADLRILLGISASVRGECDSLLILSDGSGQLGIMVGEFGDMATVGAGEVKSATLADAEGESGLIRGVAPDGVIVINPAGLLAHPDVSSRKAE
jgi:chemotaxis signal transduction protein